MEATLQADMEIEELNELVKSIYAKHNIILKTPKHTLFHKTYQYKYLKTFNEHIKKNNIDEKLKKFLIEYIVKYSISNKLIKKGYSIFFQKNVIELCYKLLLSEQASFKNFKINYVNMVNWIKTQYPNLPIKSVLLKRTNGLSNLLLWYKSSKISNEMLAVSKDIRSAIDELPPIERQQLPDDVQLYLLRARIKELSQL